MVCKIILSVNLYIEFQITPDQEAKEVAVALQHGEHEGLTMRAWSQLRNWRTEPLVRPMGAWTSL